MSRSWSDVSSRRVFLNNDFPMNQAEATKYIKFAPNKNMPPAQMTARACAFLGIGCCADMTEVEEFFKKAADQGEKIRPISLTR
jgi:TPR repeat protein